MVLKGKILTVLALILLTPGSNAWADAYASEEAANRAVGHYARARALLIEALSEFEHAESIAKPDLLIDTESWKLSVVTRTEDLNRVLDPKPKVSRSGARFKANGLHVQHERTRLPKPAPAPYTVNYAGEDAVMQAKAIKEEYAKLVAEREALEAEKKAFEAKRIEEKYITREEIGATDATGVTGENSATGATSAADETASVFDSVIEPTTEKVKEAPKQSKKVKTATAKTEVSVSSEPVAKGEARASLKVKSSEDPAVSKAIEEVIRERLNELEKEKK